MSRARSEPYTRPAFPRASSATSGFFFCGIMLDPVAKASGNSMKPNSALAHRTSSSASREMCMARTAQHARNSTAKSRSATASTLLAAILGKFNSLAT